MVINQIFTLFRIVDSFCIAGGGGGGGGGFISP